MPPAASFFQPGRTALITGGASGIGLALARRCQAHGMRVLVADNDDDLLAFLIRKKDVASTITTFKMDVSQPDDWAKVAKKINQDFGGKLHLLALNAGVMQPRSDFADPSSFLHILDVNFFGVVNGIAALLPAIKATAAAEASAADADPSSSAARVVITGSKQGITNPPGNPAYNASKAAVRSVAEQLSFELCQEPGNPAVHLLVPGWTFTGMVGNRPSEEADQPEKPKGAWSPEQVVDYLEGKMADPAAFYVVCPDGETSEEMDKKRVLWSAGDLVEGRPPLSRWRDDWKAAAQQWMDAQRM